MEKEFKDWKRENWEDLSMNFCSGNNEFDEYCKEKYEEEREL